MNLGTFNEFRAFEVIPTPSNCIYMFIIYAKSSSFILLIFLCLALRTCFKNVALMHFKYFKHHLQRF